MAEHKPEVGGYPCKHGNSYIFKDYRGSGLNRFQRRWVAFSIVANAYHAIKRRFTRKGAMLACEKFDKCRE